MPRYPWNRYWCRPTGHFPLDTNGFLLDPQKWPIGGAVPLGHLEAHTCLILLGEPGIGKSTALESEFVRLRSTGTTTESLWVDLRRIGDGRELVETITESEPWKAWRRGEVDLHLFLDSLDEGRLRISNLGEVLIDTLKKFPLERLFLRIACRTADWPATLQDELTALCISKRGGDAGPDVFELVILRQDDARLAAELEGLNPEAFMAKVVEKGAGPLAAKPATLELLLKLAKKGKMPSSQVELYELGCLELSQEPNPNRWELADVDPRFPLPDSQEVLATASRIAAVTLLCNRYAIHLGKDSDGDEGDILISELVGGHEFTVGSEGFQVEDRHVRQALRCGLFSSRGRNRMGWAHQTYAEYLAARFLRKAPLVQLESLLTITGHLIPQLYQTASWLASMRPDVFQWMIGIDPSIVLRSDVATADSSAKIRLVEQLMQAFQDERLLSTTEIRAMFHKLRHPGLGAQLQPYIENRDHPSIIREVAMEIALQTGASDVAPLLADIALNVFEVYSIRCRAALGVVRLGDVATKKRLEPLALGEAGDDPDDSLRGHGLLCVWPDHWTTVELLPRLIRPSRHDLFVGPYQMFLSEHVVPHILDDDLPYALSVAAAWDDDHRHEHRVAIIHGLVRRATDLMDSPRVRAALARAITEYLHRRYELPGGSTGHLSTILDADPETRLLLLHAMLSDEDWADRDLFRLITNGIVRPADVPWILDRIEQGSAREQAIWVALIDWVLRAEDSPRWSDRLVEVCQQVAPLRDKLEWMFQVWPLNAPESRKAKARHLRELRRQKRIQGKPLIPSPRERLELSLAQVEAGEPVFWIDVCVSLALTPVSPYFYSFPTDLEKTPGWPDLNSSIRERIVCAARKYLLECPPGKPDWFGKNERSFGVLAGYPAFRVLARAGSLATIPPSAWAGWVPAIVAIPIDSADEVYRQIIQATRSIVPESVADCVRGLIVAEETYALHHLEACWDGDLDAVVLDYLQRGLVTPKTRTVLAERLVGRGHLPSVDWLVHEVVGLTRNPTDALWLTDATVLALAFGGASGWPAVQSTLMKYPDIGEHVLLNLAHRFNWEKPPFPGDLSEDALGILLAFVIGKFPPETDPNIRGVHSVTPREEAGRLRETLLGQVVNRGARDIMHRLLAAFPAQASYLKWYLYQTEEINRRKTWSPPAARHLLSLMKDNKRRHVETGDQLIEVVVSALEELENHLHGPWTTVRLLWNDHPRVPKDEHALSDFLAERLSDELQGKGVIVNREVQIKRGVGIGPTRVPGERTDLHIQAIRLAPALNRAEVLTVVLEVKGCWNPHILDDMQSQLCERYLIGNGLTHGMYVTGWFLCDSWDDSDRDRKSRTAHKNIDDARSYFDQQAKRLATENPQIQLKAITLDVRIGRER